MIADNELDFHVSYENKDEMGTLCKEFEMMPSLLLIVVFELLAYMNMPEFYTALKKKVVISVKLS